MRMKSRVVPVVALGAALAASLVGCAKSPESVEPRLLQPATRSGAQLWADHCVRCHQAPPLVAYSDSQWELISQHMRTQASLVGSEQRAIAEFLKSSN